jgi:tryptophanase
MKTIIEPFRIKMVEPIKLTTPGEREAILQRAHFNVFMIPAEEVIIDLLTDRAPRPCRANSGRACCVATSPMLEPGAGTTSRRCCVNWPACHTSYRPTKGRASERILFELVGGPGKVIPSNNHFDTTRANIEHSGGRALDLVIDEGTQPQNRLKGNLDVHKLEAPIAEVGAERIPL